MKQRYYSLDVFRGATVCLMILVNNPGSSHVYSPLDHAPWHGVTPTDLVFPFFLFAVGNAMAFVMPRLQAAGDAAFWKKVIKRTLLIWGIGIFLTWYPFMQYSGDHISCQRMDMGKCKWAIGRRSYSWCAGTNCTLLFFCISYYLLFKTQRRFFSWVNSFACLLVYDGCIRKSI